MNLEKKFPPKKLYEKDNGIKHTNFGTGNLFFQILQDQ